MIINSSIKNWPLARRKKALQQRANLLKTVRDVFVAQGFLAVETPHRIPAPAPESYIDAIPSGYWFLHTSPELCMKRMLAAGYEKIFQICRCWREGERGRQHIPEFTLLEWYHSGIDYRMLMEECCVLIQTVASKVGLGERIFFRQQGIDLTSPWERISVSEAFHKYARTSMDEALKDGRFDEIMVQDIEPRLGISKPTFVYDYPAQRGALARLKPEDKTVAERFELYVGGLELANGFSITEKFRIASNSGRFIAVFPADNGYFAGPFSLATGPYTGQAYSGGVFTATVFNVSRDDLGNTINEK